jgi:hypothetical protein
VSNARRLEEQQSGPPLAAPLAQLSVFELLHTLLVHDTELMTGLIWKNPCENTHSHLPRHPE